MNFEMCLYCKIQYMYFRNILRSFPLFMQKGTPEILLILIKENNIDKKIVLRLRKFSYQKSISQRTQGNEGLRFLPLLFLIDEAITEGKEPYKSRPVIAGSYCRGPSACPALWLRIDTSPTRFVVKWMWLADHVVQLLIVIRSRGTQPGSMSRKYLWFMCPTDRGFTYCILNLISEHWPVFAPRYK